MLGVFVLPEYNNQRLDEMMIKNHHAVEYHGQSKEEIQEQQPIQEEVYEQPTVMSFSFLSTMNHVETSINENNNENNIEDITEEKEEVINETTNLVEDDSETKIIKTDKYDNCTVKELKDILTEKNLPTSGNKTKLIQRIIENTE